MGSTFLAVLVAGIGLGAFLRIARDPRADRRLILRTLASLALYAVFLIGGVAAVLAAFPDAAGPALPGILAFTVGWVSLSVLLFIRWAPRLKPPPSPRTLRVMRVVEIAMAALAAGAVLWLLSVPPAQPFPA